VPLRPYSPCSNFYILRRQIITIILDICLQFYITRCPNELFKTSLLCFIFLSVFNVPHLLPLRCPVFVAGHWRPLQATWLSAQRGKQTAIDFNCSSPSPLSSSRFVRLAWYYQSDGITERDKGWAFSMHGGAKKCIQVFGEKNWTNRPLGISRWYQSGS